MKETMLAQLPDHIRTVRQGSLIWTRYGKAEWSAKDYMTKGNAKRYVRIDLGCKGGPRSAVRTAESLGLE